MAQSAENIITREEWNNWSDEEKFTSFRDTMMFLEVIANMIEQMPEPMRGEFQGAFGLRLGMLSVAVIAKQEPDKFRDLMTRKE